MVVLFALTGCGTATKHVSAPRVPQRPSLRTKPTKDSVLQFGCPARQVSTVDIEACEARDTLRLNAKFNAEVKALWPMLDAKSKRDFADGQRLWKRFLADECDIAYRQYLGGTIRGPIGGECFVDLTRVRVKEVAAMLASRSGH